MELKVAFLNCRSHGDCAVITFKEKRKPACIVVDGGEDKKSAKALADYLAHQNVRTVDLMVGTHIDSDHINGLKHFVLDQVKKKSRKKPYIMVREFWGPMPSEEYVQDIHTASSPETGEPGDTITWQQYVIQSVKQNDDLYEALQELGAVISHPDLDNKPKVPFKGVKIELLGPDSQIPADQIKRKALGLPSALDNESPIKTLEDLKDAIADGFQRMSIMAKRNANNQSIVFRLAPATGAAKAKKWAFLFTGDAEEEAWDEMVGNDKVGPRLKARVLKIPHHGSSLNGITDEGAHRVNPSYSVNSVGQKHGLPDGKTLALLQGVGSQILCTQRNQSNSHKSACHDIKASDCPAEDKYMDIIFTLDTKTGDCIVTPGNRDCKHSWQGT